VYKNFIKPLLDFLFSITLLLLLSPFYILIPLLILAVNKTNPFFYQKRPGKYGVIFTLIKFKTMNNKRDDNGKLLSDEERLNHLGKFLRKTSLDEIPQLFNVISGNMSLIGPRPLLIEYLPLYNDFQKKRHNVKPGITGWAQVNGRNAISWNDKFKYDIFYVENISLLLDIKIFFKTIKKVFLRKDINKEGEATMHRFKGN
jgi:undecaprenyl phosphate N,N'-diacetylbacillosamine 1-phosphate transferase